MPLHPVRLPVRLLRFARFSTAALRDLSRTVAPFEQASGAPDYRRRAEWSHRHARVLCRLMNWNIVHDGDIPAAQLYGANHLGYLDIVTLASRTPVVFVSKAEVRNWPVVGRLATGGGTLYLQREKKGELTGVIRQFEEVARHGIPVVVFLEGTSSCGDEVLPFRPSLLAPAVEAGWQVAPVALDYAISKGTVAADVAYWRDMTFVPHFLNLLSAERLDARVTYGAARPAGADRKVLAKQLREEVVQMRRPLASGGVRS